MRDSRAGMGSQEHSPKRQKNFICRYCSKPFGRHEHVQRHERLHTKEKPFRCTRCPSAYTRRDVLIRHMSSTHAGHGIEGLPLPMVNLHASSYTGGNIQTNYPSPTNVVDVSSSSTGASPTHFTPNTPLSFEPVPENAVQNNDSARSISSTGLNDDLTSTFNLDFDQFLSFSPSLLSASLSSPLFYPDLVDYRRSHSSSTPGSFPWSLQGIASIPGRTGDKQKLYWTITDNEWDNFLVQTKQYYQDTGFPLPRRQRIARYLAAYFRTFHEHLPFLHASTITLDKVPADLILAISAVGAHNCLEKENSISLFQTAKTAVLRKVDECRQFRLNVRNPARGDFRNSTCYTSNGDSCYHDPVHVCQTLFLLMVTATWGDPSTSLKEDMYLHGILAAFVREERLLDLEPVSDSSWDAWIRTEGAKRTILIIFCFFHFHTIIYNIPPPIMNAEINLSLPCREEEWRCSSENAWREVHSEVTLVMQPQFGVAFKGLFNQSATPNLECCSTLGVYILISAMIQHIYFVRQLGKHAVHEDTRTEALPSAQMDSLYQALRTWQKLWEMDPDRSLDPVSPHGPLSFNSTAQFRMAYIRISVDIGSSFNMQSQRPEHIAAMMLSSPMVPRNRHTTCAALHAAQTLSIPVKMGVNLSARSQALAWSLQHSLSYIESAFLLSKWLSTIHQTSDGMADLNIEEKQVLTYVQDILAEAEVDSPTSSSCHDMSLKVIRIWTKLLHEGGVWPIVGMVGKALALYSDLLEKS